MNSHREAGLNFLRAQNAFRSSELYRTRNITTSGLPDELSQDYQMNFHWNLGLPDELSLRLRITTLRTGSLIQVYGLGL